MGAAASLIVHTLMLSTLQNPGYQHILLLLTNDHATNFILLKYILPPSIYHRAYSNLEECFRHSKKVLPRLDRRSICEQIMHN